MSMSAYKTILVLSLQLGVLVFGVFVLRLVRQGAHWLRIGWLLHPVWDLALHAPLGAWTHAPARSALACLDCDVVVGPAILRASGSTRNDV